MFCNTNQFSSLSFCGPHTKPHGFRGFSKHFHMRFEKTVGNGICAIRRITCACDEFTYICYTNPGFLFWHQKQQPRYWPVTDWSYWSVIRSFNNWNIFTLSHKSTKSEAFEEIHQVVLDGISENMASFFQSGKYGAMNTIDTSKMGYYVIKFVSEAYNL